MIQVGLDHVGLCHVEHDIGRNGQTASRDELIM